MFDWFEFEWVFISWIITVYIHFRNTRRSAISDNADELKKLFTEIQDLKWLDDDDKPFFNEERYNSLLNRVLWKAKQLNKLAHCKIFGEDCLEQLYGFDIEGLINTKSKTDKKCYLRNKPLHDKRCILRAQLEEVCSSMVETVDKNYFDKILDKKLLSIDKYVLAGVFTGCATVYLFIDIMRFFFKS